MTKEIRLTQGKVAVVDDEDYKYLSQYNWCVSVSNPKAVDKNFYAVRGRKMDDIPGPYMVRMHRVVLGMDGDTELDIDHVDGDTLNNVKGNLRACSRSENFYNKGKKVINGKSSSKFKGVWWNKLAKKWQAAVWCNKTRYTLGCFDDEQEAALAYDEKAKELHGQFAKTNF